MPVRQLLLYACIALMVAPAAALAQDVREDGIKAFTRGDYAAAGRILRPLAEDTQPADHVAQFIMGMLWAARSSRSPKRLCVPPKRVHPPANQTTCEHG